MRAMKDSGIEWIGEIPQDWVVGKISYFVKIYTGNSISDSEKDNYAIEDGIPYISTKDIDVVSAKANYENGLNVPYDSTFKTAPTGTTLLCIEGGSAGKKIAYIDREVAFVNKLCAFVSDNINKKYLYYYIFSDAFVAPFNLNITGLIGGVSQSLLNKFSLIIPLQKDQERIANFLDNKCEKIDRLIALQEEMIKELKAYKQSVITEAVTKGLDLTVPMKDSGIEWIGKIPEGWIINRIKYICEFNHVVKYGQYDNISYAPMECVGRGTLEYREIDTQSINSGLTSFANGDIVMAKVTPCFENGNIAIASNLLNGVGVGSSELFVFTPTKANTKWLFYFLQNTMFKELAKASMTGTGGLKRVSPLFVYSLSLALPKTEDQEKISYYLDKKCAEIDNLISIKQSKIDELKEYKKSLIYEYVTGKKEVI